LELVLLTQEHIPHLRLRRTLSHLMGEGIAANLRIATNLK
jgi:hypothetical protein